MRPGSHHQRYTVWPSRPFKITYLTASGDKLGSIVSCSSPEAVVRSTALRLISGRATEAQVHLDGDLFADMLRESDGRLRFTVF